MNKTLTLFIAASFWKYQNYKKIISKEYIKLCKYILLLDGEQYVCNEIRAADKCYPITTDRFTKDLDSHRKISNFSTSGKFYYSNVTFPNLNSRLATVRAVKLKANVESFRSSLAELTWPSPELHIATILQNLIRWQTLIYL